MSLRRTITITCKACDTEQKTAVWDTVNVTVNPEMKDEVIGKRVNTCPCAHCGEEIVVDMPFMYNDMELKFCVRYVSMTEFSTEKTYTQFKKDGSLSIGGLARQMAEENGGTYLFHPHCVFSMREVSAYVVFRDICAELGLE